MTGVGRLHLFEAFGVELEYMIVGRETLDVLAVADRLLAAVNGGAVANSAGVGLLEWSNELALHVIEFKNPQPRADLPALAEDFAAAVTRANDELARLDARLMPTAMHPWMDPERETRLWPHDDSAIYEAFDRCFGCRGHGWSNLQSMHLNLPFADDAEFAALHRAVRLLLPALPALVASSPLQDAAPSGALCTRLRHYAANCARMPAVTGLVVPEPIANYGDYRRVVVDPLGVELARAGVADVLDPVWVNARGAMARFDRGSIELRVLDLQERPAADCAIAALIVAVLRGLVEERWSPAAAQEDFSTEALRARLDATVGDGERAAVDAPYAAALGVRQAADFAELWRQLIERCGREGLLDAAWSAELAPIVEHGPLARRILDALGDAPDRARLQAVYDALCGCLHTGTAFIAS